MSKVRSGLIGMGVTEYALVEQDDCYGGAPFDCLRRSLGYLRAMSAD